MARRAYLDVEDQRQEAELARLLAGRDGGDPDLAARRAMARADKAEQRHRARVATNHGDAGESPLHWLDEARKVVAKSRPARTRPPGDDRTPGQRRRATRDAIILAASLAGFTERQIAESFDLAGSQSVHRILVAMRRRTGLHHTPGRG